jgi:putative endonuclease
MMFSRVMFGFVNLAARRGFTDVSRVAESSITERKKSARMSGMRGETFAYWYLRRHGYVIIARNFQVPGMHGELDIVGYDGGILAFVEVKLRAYRDESERKLGLPEDAITPAKKRNLVRMAKNFLATWRIRETQCRFDVLAIESQSNQAPRVRLHKDAFGADA